MAVDGYELRMPSRKDQGKGMNLLASETCLWRWNVRCEQDLKYSARGGRGSQRFWHSASLVPLPPQKPPPEGQQP